MIPKRIHAKNQPSLEKRPGPSPKVPVKANAGVDHEDRPKPDPMSRLYTPVAYRHRPLIHETAAVVNPSRSRIHQDSARRLRAQCQLNAPTSRPEQLDQAHVLGAFGSKQLVDPTQHHRRIDLRLCLRRSERDVQVDVGRGARAPIPRQRDRPAELVRDAQLIEHLVHRHDPRAEAIQPSRFAHGRRALATAGGSFASRAGPAARHLDTRPGPPSRAQHHI